MIARAALEPGRRAGGRGLDPRRHHRAGPPALRVPPAALQDPGREDRGRGRDRGGLAALPADDARDLRRPARGAGRAAQQPRDLERGDAPRGARARPGGVAAGGLAFGHGTLNRPDRRRDRDHACCSTRASTFRASPRSRCSSEERGRAALRRYFEPFLDTAQRARRCRSSSTPRPGARTPTGARGSATTTTRWRRQRDGGRRSPASSPRGGPT